MSSTAIAHTNIALIKYWGKQNKELKIPTTNSLSLTLDPFYTKTTLEFIDNDESILYLNDKLVDSSRINSFFSTIKNYVGDFPSLLVKSTNCVPTSAGLASSASAFAALTAALCKQLNLDLSLEDMSKLSRLGSGSSARSFFPNFAIWNKGYDHESSFAELLLDDDLGLCMLVLEVSDQKKEISSSRGMQLVQQSSYYAEWIENSEKQFNDMKWAVLHNDIEQIGHLTESNGLSMHELNKHANPPFDYLTDYSYELISFIQTLRNKKGYFAFVTADAGPNIKVLTTKAEAVKLQELFQENYPTLKTQIALSGPGIQYE